MTNIKQKIITKKGKNETIVFEEFHKITKTINESLDIDKTINYLVSLLRGSLFKKLIQEMMG